MINIPYIFDILAEVKIWFILDFSVLSCLFISADSIIYLSEILSKKEKILTRINQNVLILQKNND